jgi:hypothetical protein
LIPANKNTPVVVDGPTIDKVSYIFDIVADEHKKAITDVCIEAKQYPMPGVVRGGGKGYKFTFRIYHPDQNSLSNKDFILLQLKPISAAPFCRVEYNPSKISKSHYMFFEKFLFDMLEIDLPVSLNDAQITRLDACVNILNIDMEDLGAYSKQARFTQTVLGSDGRIGTIYFGKSKSNQITLYDKAKEQGNALGGKLRLEARIKNCGKLTALSDLKNPFLRVVFVNLWSKFNDSIRYRVLTNALKRLSPVRRAEFKQILSNDGPVWWQPGVLWTEHWPAALKSAALLPSQCMVKKFSLEYNDGTSA